MSTITSALDDLNSNIIIVGSCLGAVCGVLLVAVVGLIIWNIKISRKIKKMDPLINFKIQRPRRFVEETPAHQQQQQRQQSSYDNPVYPKNPMSQPEKQERRDLNPIAIRSKASFDNGNFIFGNPHNMPLNSFKAPDYLDQDRRFY